MFSCKRAILPIAHANRRYAWYVGTRRRVRENASVPFSRTRRRVPRVPSICMRDLENVSPFFWGHLAYLPYPTSLNPTEIRSLHENVCFHVSVQFCQSHMQIGGTHGTLVRSPARSKRTSVTWLARTRKGASHGYVRNCQTGARGGAAGPIPASSRPFPEPQKRGLNVK